MPVVRGQSLSAQGGVESKTPEGSGPAPVFFNILSQELEAVGMVHCRESSGLADERTRAGK